MSAKSIHKPHILPLSAYFGVALALLVMTVVTVAAASVDFGEWNLIIAMLIAIFKATLVALIFMHLFWDDKFYSIVFVSSLVFLGFFLTLTMYDTLKREGIYTERGRPIVPAAIIYDSPENSASESGLSDSLEIESSQVAGDSALDANGEDTAASEDEDWGFE
jgi:cytochrome c oxidase subunit IV